MSELNAQIRAHARAHVKDLTARTTELVGEVIAKGMVGVLEECIAMHLRIQELEAELERRTQPSDKLDAGEGMELLSDLMDNIRKHGNYSEEATLNFLGQIKQCFDAAIRASSHKEG